MNRSLGNVIADSLHLSLGYTDRLLTALDASTFARFAKPGGESIESNHPAFILGHLCIYAPHIATQLGRDELAVPVSEQIQQSCSKDAKCVDDPDGAIYPAMDEIIETFRSGYGNTMVALREAEDTVLQQANPTVGRMSELFPTIGSMHAFYVGGHMMMHLGQLSAWRRMQKMGPA